MARNRKHNSRKYGRPSTTPVTGQEIAEVKLTESELGNDPQASGTTPTTDPANGATSEEAKSCDQDVTGTQSDESKELSPEEFEELMGQHGYHKASGFTMIIPMGSDKHAASMPDSPFARLMEAKVAKIKGKKIKLRKKDLKKIHKMIRNELIVNRRILRKQFEAILMDHRSQMAELITGQASGILDEIMGAKSGIKDLAGMMSMLKDQTAAVKDMLEEPECDCDECTGCCNQVKSSGIQMPSADWGIKEWVQFIEILDEYMDND